MEEKREIRFGDLVRWEAGEKMRVGVVTSVGSSGTCSISMMKGKETVMIQIRASRLELIASTIEPEAPVEVAPATEEPKKVVRRKKRAAAKKGTTKKAARGKKKTTKKKTSRKTTGAKKKVATGKKTTRGRKKKKA